MRLKILGHFCAFLRFKCQPGSQPLQSVGTSRNITSVSEVSRRGGFLPNVGTEFKLMQELLRHSSLRSTLDIFTQAITPAKHAEGKGRELDEETAGGCNQGTKTCPFTPQRGFVEIDASSLVKEWRGRRDSNSRPLPRQGSVVVVTSLMSHK
jgi:hypothetical protein